MQSSYYKSTDVSPSYINKKMNYLDLFGSLLEPEYEDFQFEDQDPANDIEEQEFQPRIYSIKRQSMRNYGDNIDASIAGLLHIMDSDPNLKGRYRITSLYRAGATTKQGKPSYHGSGKAVDIVPVAGSSFDELERNIMANRELVEYMLLNGLGILDEYTPNGYQSRTGATGSHMHIGPDRLALKCQQKLYTKYGWA